MLSQKQLDAWRKTEMEKTTLPLVSDLKEAAVWEIVGRLIDEVEVLRAAMEAISQS